MNSKNTLTFISALFIFVLVFASASTFASAVTITSLYALAANSGAGGPTDTSTSFGNRVLDTAGTSYDTTGSNSRQELSLVGSSNGALFQFDLEQERAAGIYNGYVGSEVRTLNFTANQNTTFAMSGYYSVSEAGIPGHHVIDVALYDSTAGAIFQQRSTSRATNNETLSVGVAGGDYDNYLYGSFTGNLIAGRSYQLLVNTWIWSQYTISTAATASGCFAFEIGSEIGQNSCGDGAPVPAPFSVLLLLSGLLGLAAVKRSH